MEELSREISFCANVARFLFSLTFVFIPSNVWDNVCIYFLSSSLLLLASDNFCITLASRDFCLSNNAVIDSSILVTTSLTPMWSVVRVSRRDSNVSNLAGREESCTNLVSILLILVLNVSEFVLAGRKTSFSSTSVLLFEFAEDWLEHF